MTLMDWLGFDSPTVRIIVLMVAAIACLSAWGIVTVWWRR